MPYQRKTMMEKFNPMGLCIVSINFYHAHRRLAEAFMNNIKKIYMSSVTSICYFLYIDTMICLHLKIYHQFVILHILRMKE